MNTLEQFFPGIAVEIFFAAVMLAAARGCGGALLRYFKEKSSGIAQLACGMAAMGIIGIAVPEYILRYLLFIPAAYGFFLLASDIRKELLPYSIIALLTLILLGSALLPPMTWDEQVYQIALLKRYVNTGNFAVCQDNPYSAYPSLAHAYLLWGFRWGGLTLPRLVLVMLTAVLSAAFYTRMRTFGRMAAVIVLAGILFSPLSRLLNQSFYTETFILLFAFAGAEALLEKKITARVLLTAGIAAGGACAVKFTGGGVALALAVMLIFRSMQFRILWIFFAAAFLTLLPFLLRIAVGTGNPFYPWLSGVFGTPAAAEVEKFHYLLGSHYGLNALEGTVFGWLFSAWERKIYDGVLTGFQFPLFFIAAAAGSYLMQRNSKDKRFTMLLMALITLYIFWGISSRQTRFMQVILWGSAALTLAVLPQRRRLRQLLLAAVCAASLLSLALEYRPFMHYYYSYRFLKDARRSPFLFAARRDELYAELIRRIHSLDSKARIGLTLERRTLYLPDNVRIIMPYFQEKFSPVPDSADEVMKVLTEFDYLVISQPLIDVDRAPEYDDRFNKFYDLLALLCRQGKLRVVPDCYGKILRVVPQT